MAKKSMIAREAKRLKLVEKHQQKRQELKSIIISLTTTDEEKIAA